MARDERRGRWEPPPEEWAKRVKQLKQEGKGTAAAGQQAYREIAAKRAKAWNDSDK